MMVSDWSRSSKQSRDANTFSQHRHEQERGGTTMHTITHCFFSQSRLYSFHPRTFRPCNLAPTQCMLNNSTCLYSLCKKAEHDPLHHSPVHACIRSSYTLLPYSFYPFTAFIALTLMLSCNVSYAFSYLFVLRLGRRFRHQDIFTTQHTLQLSPFFLLIPPVN